MDYSDLVKASEAADLAYAKWYAQLPASRKADFFLSGFQFVADKVRHDVKKENPFATEAEITLRFIELTQKDSYSEEVFTFIREKMLQQAEEEWKQRFKAMKQHFGWTYEEIARFMGAAGADSLKTTVSRQLPAFAKLAVVVFEAGRAKE